MAETNGLLNRRAVNAAPRVRIPPSPPQPFSELPNPPGKAGARCACFGSRCIPNGPNPEIFIYGKGLAQNGNEQTLRALWPPCGDAPWRSGSGVCRRAGPSVDPVRRGDDRTFARLSWQSKAGICEPSVAMGCKRWPLPLPSAPSFADALRNAVARWSRGPEGADRHRACTPRRCRSYLLAAPARQRRSR